MAILSITQFRANLYKIIDEAITHHKPIQISRNGEIIELVVNNQQKINKLDNLQPHPNTIIGDPDDLVHIDWSKNWTWNDEI